MSDAANVHGRDCTCESCEEFNQAAIEQGVVTRCIGEADCPNEPMHPVSERVYLGHLGWVCGDHWQALIDAGLVTEEVETHG